MIQTFQSSGPERVDRFGWARTKLRKSTGKSSMPQIKTGSFAGLLKRLDQTALLMISRPAGHSRTRIPNESFMRYDLAQPGSIRFMPLVVTTLLRHATPQGNPRTLYYQSQC